MMCWSMSKGGASGKARATCTTSQCLGDYSEVEYHGPERFAIVDSNIRKYLRIVESIDQIKLQYIC